MVAVGTGIGGGIVAGGDLLLGSNGRAGEVGHQVIDVHGPHCGCGNSGCVESLASGPAIATEAARLVLQGIPTGLREACNGDVSRITPRLVAHTAAAGDAKAREIIEQEAERLGILAANLTLVLNPERIIVGGGVSLIGEPLLEGMRRTIAARIGWYTRRAPVDVVAAALGEEAGAMGAAAWGRAKA
jgi:glucokinase